MSPLTSIDPALFKELKAGNERAFERLFRERYTTVLDEALPLLDGNAAAAARGVESAFQRVWKSHDEFTTPDDLEAHIHSAVHEAAARIKSRNEIAHHLGMRNGARARKHTPERAPTADGRKWRPRCTRMSRRPLMQRTGRIHIHITKSPRRWR
jgi:hypothetical protein